MIDFKSIGKRMSRSRYQRPEVAKSGKRNKVWKAEWHVYVVGEDGKERRKHRTGLFGLCAKVTRAEAQERCDAQVARETGQRSKPDGAITLARFWESVYRPVRAARWAPNTRAAMDSTWKLHVEPKLGAIALEDFNKNLIELHLVNLAEGGAGKQLVERVRIILCAMFTEAVDSDYLQKSPARKVEMPACRAEEPTRSMTEAEVARLFSATSGRDRLQWRLLVLCGMRVGEMLALTRDDITAAGLRIDESELKGKASTTKNKRVRVAPLPAALRAELSEWIGQLPASQALLFPNRDGRMCRRNSLLPMIGRGRTLARIPDLTPRMCRTTFATLFDGDLMDAQDILGHHSPEFTAQVYKRPIAERAQKAVDELDKRLRKVVQIRKKA